jgi:NTP pyrophosphatase (non-canonical NTP hydrolase)
MTLTKKGAGAMTENEILTAAIRAFGVRAQEEVAIEECSELIQAISHKHRGREHNIAEEIADVEIMLEQLKIIQGCHNEVENIKKRKIERLYDRICDVCF